MDEYGDICLGSHKDWVVNTWYLATWSMVPWHVVKWRVRSVLAKSSGWRGGPTAESNEHIYKPDLTRHSCILWGNFVMLCSQTRLRVNLTLEQSHLRTVLVVIYVPSEGTNYCSTCSLRTSDTLAYTAPLIPPPLPLSDPTMWHGARAPDTKHHRF